MEITNYRCAETLIGQPLHNLGNRRGCGIIVYRDPHYLTASTSEMGNLRRGAGCISGIRISH
jgi:hypothetical protein